MKIFKTVFVFVSVLLLGACSKEVSTELPEPFKLIPQPQKMEVWADKGLAYQELTHIVLRGLDELPVLGTLLSGLSQETTGGKATLNLVLNTTNAKVKNPEGYVMTIDGGNVKIESAGKAGLFYGCQTLEQLLEDARDFDAVIPNLMIMDYPALPYRAIHIDVKHHLDRMSYYYESIDRMAKYKINAVIFEVEDKLGYEKQSTVAAPQAFSLNDLADLTRYAAKRHIDISPLVQGLGHATFILKHQEYEYLREIPEKRWVSCSMDEGTYELYADLMHDAFKATPGSKYVHIGGDEIGDIGLCDRCKDTGEEIGELGLYLHWLNNICDIANEYGRIPIFWDDMPLKMAGVYESTHNANYDSALMVEDWKIGELKLDELIERFPKNSVYMRWNYEMGTLPGNIKAIDWYKNNDLLTMVSTAAQTNAVLFPKDERTGSVTDGGLRAIKSFVQLAGEKQLDGMFCTTWDDKSPHYETYWRGIIASAEYSWSSNDVSLEDYDHAYLQREFAISHPDYYKLYSQLRKAAKFWDKAYMRNGSRLDIENALFNLPGLAHWIPESEKGKKNDKIDFTDKLIEIPNINSPGEWSQKYDARLKEAEIIMEHYSITSKEIDELYAGSKRNKYHWEIFKVLNDFQVTAPRLLLALKQTDVADENLRAKGLESVQSAIDDFDASWDNLKTVYSKTRFIEYPDNYVPDRYFHFASQRENLSWMIQVEELFHTMIKASQSAKTF